MRIANRASNFSQADVKRVVAGVLSAGLSVAHVEITFDGRILVVCGEPSTAARRVNPLDRLLINGPQPNSEDRATLRERQMATWIDRASHPPYRSTRTYLRRRRAWASRSSKRSTSPRKAG